MKKILVMISVFIMLLVSVLSVNAVTLGADDVEASNIDDDRESEMNVYKSFTLGGSSYGANFSNCVLDYDTNKYVNKQNEAVEKNLNTTYSYASGTVTVNMRIPENLDAIDTTNYEPSSIFVGTVKCDLTNGSSVEEQVNMQREHMFEIDKIEAEFENSVNTLNDDDEDLEDIETGQTITMVVYMDNNFDDDDGIDMDTDVSVSCDPDDIDIYPDEDDVDISYDDSESLEFDLELDEDDVDEDTYTCTFTAVATDEFGAKHGEQWEIDIDVIKEDYKLRVESFRIDPSSITCLNRNVQTITSIKNIGAKDDDEIKLEISVPGLGITESVVDFEIEESNSQTKMLNFLVPETDKHGSFDVYAKAYTKGLLLSDQKTVKLDVPDCSPEEEEEEEEDTTTVIISNDTQQQTGEDVQDDDEEVDTVAPGEDEEEQGLGLFYIGLLGAVVVVLLVGVVGLLIYLFKA